MEACKSKGHAESPLLRVLRLEVSSTYEPKPNKNKECLLRSVVSVGASAFDPPANGRKGECELTPFTPLVSRPLVEFTRNSCLFHLIGIRL